MPQEFHVVKCYNCKTFQVQIIKKVNKFECKMCGEKQSVKKEYGKGTGKDCRLHVQKLNQLRIENENEVEICEESIEITNENEEFQEILEKNESKWLEYLPEPDQLQSEEETEENYSNYTFERPSKRKRSNNLNKTKKSKIINDLSKENIQEPVGSNENIKFEGSSFVEEENKGSLKPEIVKTNSESNLTKYEKNYLRVKNSGATKKSKWDNFISISNAEERSQDEEIYNNCVTSTQTDVKEIFKTDDENLDDILSF